MQYYYIHRPLSLVSKLTHYRNLMLRADYARLSCGVYVYGIPISTSINLENILVVYVKVLMLVYMKLLII